MERGCRRWAGRWRREVGGPPRGGPFDACGGLVVRRQVGDPGRGRGTGQGGARVPGGVVRRQEAHKVEAAGVEAGAVPGAHHQHVLGVVVEGGDAG